MDLTLCLIIRNEEVNLADCLSSFAGVYNKIVIADTGSTDRSKEIADSFNAKVFDYLWIDDFAAARNFALSKVESEWVMVVDADDRIDPETKKMLIGSLEKADAKVSGFFLPYNYSGSKSPNRLMAYLPRIWRTQYGYRYTLPVHEYLNIPREDIGKFTRLPYEVIHAKDPAQAKPSRVRNLRILESAQKVLKNNDRILFYLGSENYNAGNYAESIGWLDKYIRSRSQKNPDELNRIYLMKGLCCQKLGRDTQAGYAYKKAISASPELIEPYLQLGDLKLKNGDYAGAIYSYVRAQMCRLPVTHVFVNASLYRGAATKKIHDALTLLEKKRC